jgi:hypothetical protein
MSFTEQASRACHDRPRARLRLALRNPGMVLFLLFFGVPLMVRGV